MKFKIYDWAGNHKFQGETFESIEDGFERITEYLESIGMNDDEIDEILQEYEVMT